MPTNRYVGGAVPVAKVQDYLFGGTWETDDVLKATIGNGTVTLLSSVGSATITTIIDSAVTAWNALSATFYPQFARLTASRSGNYFRLTADALTVNGVSVYPDFAVTLSTTEANGSAPDSQTIDAAASSTGTTTTNGGGPAWWSSAANWSLNAAPVDGDSVILENSTQNILWGLDQSSVDLAALTLEPTYTGSLGLPKTNNQSTVTFAEYLTDYLTLGTCTTLTIRGGTRVKVNVGSNACTCNVYATGTSPETGVPAFLFKGTHPSNILNVVKGTVGVAFFGGETADLSGGLRIGYESQLENDAVVVCGSGVTLAAITKTGGALTVNGDATSLTQLGGDTVANAGDIATLLLKAGALHHKGSGVICSAACAVFKGAKLDLSLDNRAKTITPKITFYSGSKFSDPASISTLTNGFTIPDGSLLDCELNFGIGRTTYTVA